MPHQNPLELITLRHVETDPVASGGTILDIDFDVPQDHWILKSVYFKAVKDGGGSLDMDVVIYEDDARTCRRYEHIDISDAEWMSPSGLNLAMYLPNGHAYFRFRNNGSAGLAAGLIIEIILEERR